MMMRTMAITVLALAWSVSSTPVFAATAQQNKMTECNAQADAKGLKGAGQGEARRAFLKECLGSKPKLTQQDKMKQCNQQASTQGLKGDARKTFMSDCLSGK